MASSKRERELARQRAERQAARRAAERARRRQRNVILASVLAVLLVIGGGILLAVTLGGDDNADVAAAPTATTEPTEDSTPSTSASPSEAGDATTASCTYTDAGDASKKVSKPAAKAPKKNATATVRTSAGPVTISLNGAKAPCTVNSFTHLASEKYFDSTPCHRLTTDGIFVLQCGDPSGSGSGGPGYQFADENLTGAKYPAGTVAMANAGPGTNGSQFFLVYKDTQLPPNYTPFGTITNGLAVVEAIAKKGTADGGPDGKPKEPVKILGVTIS